MGRSGFGLRGLSHWNRGDLSAKIKPTILSKRPVFRDIRGYMYNIYTPGIPLNNPDADRILVLEEGLPESSSYEKPVWGSGLA